MEINFFAPLPDPRADHKNTDVKKTITKTVKAANSKGKEGKMNGKRG